MTLKVKLKVHYKIDNANGGQRTPAGNIGLTKNWLRKLLNCRFSNSLQFHLTEQNLTGKRSIMKRNYFCKFMDEILC